MEWTPPILSLAAERTRDSISKNTLAHVIEFMAILNGNHIMLLQDYKSSKTNKFCMGLDLRVPFD